MNIAIKQSHIQAGFPGEPCACPIALACLELGVDVMVCPDEVIILGPDSLQDKYRRLPQVAQDFIRAFDKGLPAEPFEFELEVQ